MNLIAIDQIKELNATYCSLIISEYKKIDFKKLVLINFLLKYPQLIKKFDSGIELKNYEIHNIFQKEEIKFYDSWDKSTIDSLKILVLKELAVFENEENSTLLSTKNTQKLTNELKSFDIFYETINRIKLLKKSLSKLSSKQIIEIING